METILNRVSDAFQSLPFSFPFSNLSSVIYSALQLTSITQSIFLPKHSIFTFDPSIYPPYEDFDIECTTSSILSKLNISSESSAAGYPISNTTIFFAENVPKGFTIPFVDNHASCQRPSQTIYEDICRIAMYVRTSESSGVHVEAWLPRKWSGRFLSTGNGGLNGCIQYEDLAYASALGFATVGTNNGHNGTSGEAFLNNPGVIEDYAYRSIHTGVLLGKHLTQRFYNKPHTKSYFLGCSTGGRQGLKSIQNFPSDFDGVVAGAPAASLNNLLSWSGHFLQLTGSTQTDERFIRPEQWTEIIHRDILEQCDELDGVRDGILEDPGMCDYVPERLICRKGQEKKKGCLTGTQAGVVRSVFAPLFGVDGEMLFPRQQPGSEDQRTVDMLYSGKLFPYTADWFRYVVYNDPTYPLTNLTLTDYSLSSHLDPFNISTWKGDLTSFRSLGGKLLVYHGQADGIIPPTNSERYYTHVARTMEVHPEDMDEFYRFFRISGMGHCSRGVGAWEIGQTLAGIGGPGGLSMNEEVEVDSEGEGEGEEKRERERAREPNERLSPERNVLVAMVRWVEEGTAPDFIEGRKYEGDENEMNPDPVLVRRHCRFPSRNRYVGVGDASLPENWKCV